MARFLLFVGLAAGLFILFRWLSRQPARAYWQLIIVMLAVGLLGLVLAGRAPWLAALLAMLLPFVRGWLSGPGPANSNTGPVGGQTSRVQSRYLRMTLNHDTGENLAADLARVVVQRHAQVLALHPGGLSADRPGFRIRGARAGQPAAHEGQQHGEQRREPGRPAREHQAQQRHREHDDEQVPLRPGGLARQPAEQDE